MADAGAGCERSIEPQVTTLLLRRLPREGLDAVAPLFARSGCGLGRLRHAAGRGALFALVEVGAPAEEAVAAALLVPGAERGVVDLVAFGVVSTRRGQGLGMRLLREVTDVLRSEGTERVRAAPAAAAMGHLYERAGFTARSSADGDGGYQLDI